MATVIPPNSPWIPASKKRRALAALIDLMLFSALWGVVDYFARVFLPGLADLPLYQRLIIFLVLELILQGILSWSPGYEFLSIRALPGEHVPFPVDGGGRYVLVVNAWIAKRESWLTVVLGILFLNDGAKSLVRWSMWNPPIPLFGFPTDPVVSAVASALVGLLEIYVGVGFFMLWRSAPPLGITLHCATMVSLVLSWNLWNPWIAEMVQRRRAYQGLPVRSGEIETMQIYLPPGMVLWSLAIIVAIIFAWKRVQRVPHRRPARLAE